MKFDKFRSRGVLFVGAERANVVGVYDVTDDPASPVFVQVLPTGSGPDGFSTIPHRGLFVVSAENSESGYPSLITIYSGDRKSEAVYPQLASVVEPAGMPLPWVAMSGLAGTPGDGDTIYGVSDSFLADGFVYTIDVSGEGGVITARTRVRDPDDPDGFFPDLEGIAVAPEGGFWLASEGRKDDGIAVRDNDVLGDPDNLVKIARWDVANQEWGFVHYEKAPPAASGWVGLSEITLLPDGTFAIVERDNQLGTDAVFKQVWQVDQANAPFTSDLTSALPVLEKATHQTLLLDLLDVLDENSLWIRDKLEGLSVSGTDGTVHIVTYNDGLDDAIGQTVFVELGPWDQLAQ